MRHILLSVLPTLLCLVAFAARGGHSTFITVTYDPSLSRVAPYLDLGDMAVAAELDLILTGSAELDKVDVHLSPFVVPDSIVRSGNFTVRPIAIASMCMSSSNSNGTGLTIEQIGAALAGNVAGITVGIRWYVASPKKSPASASLLQALVRNGVPTFTSMDTWPATVLSNPNVVVLAEDEFISAALTSCPPSVWCIGPQMGFAPWASAKQCLRIRRTVELTGDTISYTPALTPTSAYFTIVDPVTNMAYSQSTVYPFIGGVYLAVRKAAPCGVLNSVVDMLTAFFTNATNHAVMDSHGLQPMTTVVGYSTLNMFGPLFTQCTSTVLAATIGGDGNLYDAIAALNFNRYSNDNYMVSFVPGNTSSLHNAIFGNSRILHAGFVEALPSLALQATQTNIVTAPIFAHGLALAYTLDGRDALVASPCTMLGIMNGTIQYWDDPALTTDNVGIQLPHMKITRIMSYDGSQEAAGRGVTYIARRCGVTLKTPYTSYPFGSDVDGVLAYEVVTLVQNTEGAIGLASASMAIAAQMQQLAIVFPSQLQFSGSPYDLAAVISQSYVNKTTFSFSFPPRTVDYYPFVAIVYAVVDTDATGECTAFARTLDWMRFVASAEAQHVLTGSNQVVLDDTMRAPLIAAIARAKCDGVALYPVPTADAVWWPYVLCLGSVAVLIIALGFKSLHRHLVLSVRPLDPTKPLAVMFVGVKNQAAVLEAGEENAAAAFKRVADTIRETAKKHGCYEARRIDAVTMMIVAKDAKRAVACAEDIVLTLCLHIEWLDTVMTYALPQARNIDGTKGHRNSHSRKSDSKHRPSETSSEVTNDAAKASDLAGSASRRGDRQSDSAQDATLQPTSVNRVTPLTSPREDGGKKRVSYSRHPSSSGANPAMNRSARFNASHSKRASSADGKTQHTSTSRTSGFNIQRCVPEVYVGLHWTHVMIDVLEETDTVSYLGAGINTAACIADLAVGGQVIVSREFMDGLNLELGDDNDGGYHFHAVGDGKSSDELVGMSMTTTRFPEWLIARAAQRRESREDKDSAEGNMIAAAMASADGNLGKRRIAVVSMLVRDVVREGADGRASVVGETLAELFDIVTSNRGQILSIVDGVVTATVGASAPVAMAPVRAAQIAMDASELCVAIGVNCGSAITGNAMGGKPTTVGRVAAGAALMRAVASRAGVAVCATDIAKADLAAKFEVATVDLIASPWDHTKHIRCYAVVEERAQAEEGEWLYDMNDGFAPLEQRFDHHAKQATGESTRPIDTAFLARHEDITSLSDDLYAAVLHATTDNSLAELYLSRLQSLGVHTFMNGACGLVA